MIRIYRMTLVNPLILILIILPGAHLVHHHIAPLNHKISHHRILIDLVLALATQIGLAPPAQLQIIVSYKQVHILMTTSVHYHHTTVTFLAFLR